MYISKRSGMDHSFSCKYTKPAFPSLAFTRWRHQTVNCSLLGPTHLSTPKG